MKRTLHIISIYAIGLSLNFLWVTGVVSFLEGLYSYQLYKESMAATFFFSVILAPLWEEFCFRDAPHRVLKACGEKAQKQLLLPLVVFSSIIFGLAHYGVPSILIQGVGGLFLSFYYLRYGYIGSVIYHALWNLLIFILNYLGV